MTASMHKAEEPEGAGEAPAASYSVSGGLVDLMRRKDFSFIASSYQSGLLYSVGRNEQGGVHIHQCGIPKPMGLHYSGDGRLLVAGGYQIMRMENVLDEGEKINHAFDACFIPRLVHVTGTLDAHDVGALADGAPVFVNTRYNCLATTSPRHSFEPLWRPPFISALVDEDRCHLNGLAMRENKPAYATAVSRSDTIDGWRDRRDGGGIVIDIAENKIVCEGLSMPHSPRWRNGELWVLNSGTGELGVIEGLESGKGEFAPRAFCPGFLRGLAFHENYAIIGLSKPRYERFEGLPLDAKLRERDSEPWCGVQIIDLASGSCAAWFRIDGDVTELYDVEALPGFTTPMALSPDDPDGVRLITIPKS